MIFNNYTISELWSLFILWFPRTSNHNVIYLLRFMWWHIGIGRLTRVKSAIKIRTRLSLEAGGEKTKEGRGSECSVDVLLPAPIWQAGEQSKRDGEPCPTSEHREFLFVKILVLLRRRRFFCFDDRDLCSCRSSSGFSPLALKVKNIPFWEL